MVLGAITLSLGQFHRFLAGVAVFLVADAAFVLVLSGFVCLSFFPVDRPSRLLLLTASLPPFVVALCSWAAVIELYLRLRERQRRRAKRTAAAKDLEEEAKRVRFSAVREFVMDE